MDLREQINHIVDQLPENRLEEVLRLMQFFSSDEVEVEDLWLLTSGRLKEMVDALDQPPPAADDWRSHLRGL